VSLRWLVPPLVALFAVCVVVVPLVRLYVRTGALGFVGHRSPDLRHRVMGGLFLVLILLVGAYGALVGALGPERLGIVARPDWLGAIGLIGMGLGTTYVMVAQAQMGASWRIGIGDEPTALVVTGLYRWSRHPIYTGVLLWLWSLVLVVPSVFLAVVAAVIVVVVAIEARLEEQHLTAVHGDAYRDYARRVGRFFPRLTRGS
jgi:protein-S-isoprenylcysteine O-methyltransferase Ste14